MEVKGRNIYGTIHSLLGKANDFEQIYEVFIRRNWSCLRRGTYYGP